MVATHFAVYSAGVPYCEHVATLTCSPPQLPHRPRGEKFTRNSAITSKLRTETFIVDNFHETT